MKNKIAILGPKYSYCHILASVKFTEAEFLFCDNTEEIFKQVSEGKVESGIAPFENMLHGSVREAITSLEKYKVKINRAMDMPIHHCLASKSEKFTKIISHPQALAQCSRFLEEYKIKKIIIQESASTSKAMELASEDKEYAAIGSTLAAKNFGLKILKKDIENNHDNVTRFILISRNENFEFKSKNIRTSLMLIPKEDMPGLLFKMLSPFATAGINLTKIESIPTGKKFGEYIFYIEISGSIKENKIKTAIEFLKNMVNVDVLGSYEIEDVIQ